MLEWGKKTYVMGILNCTPDSFSGDSLMQNNDPVQAAIEQAKQFVHDGADILDVGAESSRPGSHPISAEKELERLVPIIKAIKQENIQAIVSIDTYKSEVARACLELGAHWINDIWALQKDPKLAEVITAYQVPVVLMHNRSQTNAVEVDSRIGASYNADRYDDFLDDLRNDLETISQFAITAGIHEENIIIDPGIGFGKTPTQNMQILNYLDKIKSMGFPVLIGPSRKSFIGKILDLPVGERVEGTAAAVTVGILKGADIIRVHDVKQMARTAAMADAIRRS